MVNFYPGFVVPEAGRQWHETRELRAKNPDRAELRKAMAEYRKAHPVPPATVAMVADHIDHIVKVAGIDHVGIGSDYDGIESVPVGLEDVSTYPRLTDEAAPAELLRVGHQEGPRRQRPAGPP